MLLLTHPCFSWTFTTWWIKKKQNINNDEFSFPDSRSRDHHNICFSFKLVHIALSLLLHHMIQEQLQLGGFFQENFADSVDVDYGFIDFNFTIAWTWHWYKTLSCCQLHPPTTMWTTAWNIICRMQNITWSVWGFCDALHFIFRKLRLQWGQTQLISNPSIEVNFCPLSDEI